MCRYLTAVSTPDGALPAMHPSQRGYPAAPFIPIVDDPPSELLATGPVVGLLHRNAGVARLAVPGHGLLLGGGRRPWKKARPTVASVRGRGRPSPSWTAAPDRAPRRRRRSRRTSTRAAGLPRERRAASAPWTPSAREDDPARGARLGAPAEHSFLVRHRPRARIRSARALVHRRARWTRSLDLLAAAQREDGGWPRPGGCGPWASRRAAPARRWRPAGLETEEGDCITVCGAYAQPGVSPSRSTHLPATGPA